MASRPSGLPRPGNDPGRRRTHQPGRPSVLVVGAGPAGSSAARLLAAEGFTVRLLEGRRLPRRKLCGGGLTPKAQRIVPPPALALATALVDHVELRAPHIPPVRITDPAARIAMIDRAAFDLALVEAAARDGAEVLDGTAVREVVEDVDEVRVRTDGGWLRADVLVAAEGEPSNVARQLGLGGRAHRLALALEAEVEPLPGPQAAVLRYGTPPGYAWYFPKGEVASLGIGAYGVHDAVDLRARLRGFAAELGIDLAGTRIAGHWIPAGLRAGPLASRRVVLAGDAAATADALFGEGISYAIVSGAAVAGAIADWAAGDLADLRAYDGRLRRLLGPALGRLDTLGRVGEVSISAALLAVAVARPIREAAVDAIAGRRPPFVLDETCPLACLCLLHGLADAAHEPCPHCRTRQAA